MDKKIKKAETDIPVMNIGFLNVFTLNEDKFPDKKFHWANATEPGWGVAVSQGWMPCLEEMSKDVLLVYTHPTMDGVESNPKAYLKRRDMVLCWMERSRWDAWQAQEREDITRTERALQGLNSRAKKLGYADKAESIKNFS